MLQIKSNAIQEHRKLPCLSSFISVNESEDFMKKVSELNNLVRISIVGNEMKQKQNLQKINSLLEEVSLNVLMDYLKSEIEIIRLLAVNVFSSKTTLNLQDQLVCMMRSDSKELKKSVLEILMRKQVERPEQILEMAMFDSLPEVRVSAIIAASELYQQMDNEKILSYLNKAVDDNNSDVSETAIDELAFIGDKSSAVTLMGSLDNCKTDEQKHRIWESLSLIMEREAFARA